MGAGSSFPLPCCTEMEALDDRVSERVSDAVAVKGCQHRHLDLQTVWLTHSLTVLLCCTASLHSLHSLHSLTHSLLLSVVLCVGRVPAALPREQQLQVQCTKRGQFLPRVPQPEQGE
jgi:hypothetical protein